MLSFFGKLIMWSGEIKGRIFTGEVRAWGHISLISSQLHLPKAGGRNPYLALIGSVMPSCLMGTPYLQG